MDYNKEIFQEMQAKFIEAFNKNWSALMEELFFQQAQFISGNRLRPYILFMGYLATKQNYQLEISEYDKISKLSLCIELIHKSSLILDDLIDGDPARHGKSAFHMEYGTENTMMFAINLLSVSVQKMNQFILENDEYIVLKDKGIALLSKTMYDMSLGELRELNLNSADRYNYKKIKEIIDLETSPLISNSLLFGYYAGNGKEKNIEDTLRLIGYECGFIFQVMNDLEAFCQQEKLTQHKGRLNTDIVYAKKNIALTLLYNLISEQEKEKLLSIHSEDDANNLLIHYFKHYKIRDSFIREVDLISEKINTQINELENEKLCSDWCRLFHYFINAIIQECKNRLI